MIGFQRIASGVVAMFFSASVAVGQFGGGGMGGGGMGGGLGVTAPPRPQTTIVGPSSQTAQSAMENLDASIELGAIKSELGKLGDLLTEKLEDVPVFVDERAIEMAQLTPATMIEGTLSELPLRSALRRLLHPHGLRVVVEEEGLVITADFTELTRRGIATDQWVNNDSEAEKHIHEALKKNLATEFEKNTPLQDAIDHLADLSDVSIVIDARALEEIGLTADTPMGPLGLRIKNARLGSILRLILRQFDLTYMVRDEALQITTAEAAEQNLINRIYFLEGTGFPLGDFESVADAIQTTIVSDTWEALGGPSTMAPITNGAGNRPAIIISTTSEVHDDIGALFSSLRRTHVGPDPRAKSICQSGTCGRQAGRWRFYVAVTAVGHTNSTAFGSETADKLSARTCDAGDTLNAADRIRRIRRQLGRQVRSHIGSIRGQRRQQTRHQCQYQNQRQHHPLVRTGGKQADADAGMSFDAAAASPDRRRAQ